MQYTNHSSPQVRLVELVAHAVVCLDQGQTQLGRREPTCVYICICM